MAVKLDMEQAYTSMGWPTLNHILNWVNVNKSQVIFGKIVKRSHKNKVASILGFWVVKELHYLGIKISLQRMGVADFQDLLSHVTDRLKVWGKKSLTLGGKITLIKTSLLSLPNFAITHYPVPKRVIHEVEKLCRKFIWHKQNGKPGLHYAAWEDICSPTTAGGLGLQSITTKVVLYGQAQKIFVQGALPPETLQGRCSLTSRPDRAGRTPPSRTTNEPERAT
ncbi:uncharacterized protein LOC114579674, partial [Dendrobium catenatum]|uniref:uncharacterized protein LOC114579674 n=1 Tax=Dendrobium catenatum TaxID=906689 RepID=UPI0010A0795B